jgi:hypothetical protein
VNSLFSSEEIFPPLTENTNKERKLKERKKERKDMLL